MSTEDVKRLFETQGIHASALHVDAAAATVGAMVKGTAERFARLPLESEPSGFQAELRHNAP
jgi:hypothetical protein